MGKLRNSSPSSSYAKDTEAYNNSLSFSLHIKQAESASSTQLLQQNQLKEVTVSQEFTEEITKNFCSNERN